MQVKHWVEPRLIPYGWGMFDSGAESGDRSCVVLPVLATSPHLTPPQPTSPRPTPPHRTTSQLSSRHHPAPARPGLETADKGGPC